ncbi:YeaC family protein [Marinomonas sp. PE14-40]|uniref:YeaC family protein n=1 Tax=Marinomonas sp. PE14-40 TaxID=3060621 RepID=UPI003F6682A7
MNFKEMIDNMSPEVYESIKLAVELGKWPNGVRLTDEQKELCLQAVITYDYSNKGEDERVGFIDRNAHLGCSSKKDTLEHETVKWVDQPFSEKESKKS